MTAKALRHGHAPTHLREAFCDWLYREYMQGEWGEFVKVDGEQKSIPWLLSQFLHCVDVLPVEHCEDLEIPQGSTYAAAAKKLVAEWDRMIKYPPLTDDDKRAMYLYLSTKLEETACDDTARFTKAWLSEHRPDSGLLEYTSNSAGDHRGGCDCWMLGFMEVFTMGPDWEDLYNRS